MKIVVSGGWSYGNIGDEVILKSTMYLINKYFPESKTLYTSYCPNKFKDIYKLDAVQSIHAIIENKNYSLTDYNRIVENIVDSELSDYTKIFENDTVFLMSGGGYFVEEWKSQFIARLLEINIAKKCGAKIIVLGQSIGPIYSDLGKKLLKSELSKCDYISVRDISTLKHLNEFCESLDINYYPDLAIIISDIIEKKESEDIIGLMPAAYTSYTGMKSTKKNKYIEKIKKRFSIGGIRYKRELTKLISELSQNNKLELILSTDWKWDIDFANYLTQKGNKENIKIILANSPDELCSKISSYKVLISTKMHPLIIASSYSVPSIGISYNFKVDNYMNMIHRSNFCYKIDNVCSKKIINQITDNKTVSDTLLYKKKVYEMMKEIKKRVIDE